MGIFSKIEKNIYSPVNGKQISLSDVPDEMFSKEMLGPAIAFDSDDNVIYAPADGKVAMLTNTKHAIGIKTKFGVDILIHIGIDTVELNGEGFSTCVRESQTVKKGQKLITFDKKSILEKGYHMPVILILTNTNKLAFKRNNVKDCICNDVVIEFK